MTHRDRTSDATGQRASSREAAGDAGHRQGFPAPPPIRPPPLRPRDRNGGFPRLSDGVPHGLRCLASPRHALLGTRSAYSEALVKSMSPTQIAEAERLVAEWKPDPSACEVEAAPSSCLGSPSTMRRFAGTRHDAGRSSP